MGSGDPLSTDADSREPFTACSPSLGWSRAPRSPGERVRGGHPHLETHGLALPCAFVHIYSWLEPVASEARFMPGLSWVISEVLLPV